MPKKTDLNVVVGFGMTGLSCVKFCLDQGWPVAVTDSREDPPEKAALKNIPPIKTAFGGFSKELIDQATLLILSPGVSLHEPVIAQAIQRGTPYLCDIELFVQRVKAPIVAITGSNGKSTVTTLVGEMAKKAGIKVEVVGNIGNPVLDTLKKPRADLYVMEISSFQLEKTQSLKAKAAVILNISQNHLDHHASMQEYQEAKARIYKHCEIAVINRAEPNYIESPSDYKKLVSFGLDQASSDSDYGLIETQKGTYLAKGNTPWLNVKELQIKGRHNMANALAAMALAEAVSIPQKAIIDTLKTFKGLKHRCQWVREKNGVVWYNDSKSTTVVATLAAVNGLGPEIKGKIVLIAGGLGKGADFSPFEKPFKQFVKHLILIGRDADKIEQGVHQAVPISRAQTFLQAIQLADQIAQPQDIVLLSPACASYDMFNNFEHRGEEFMRIVNEL